jgi:drug/metabolite transporter (DMT)-like permease
VTRFRADALLLLTAVIWGATFVAQKQANSEMGPLLFVGLRFLLGALVVAPLAWREARGAARPFDRRAWIGAVSMGLCLFAGSILQQIGLQTASATDGGFLTALYVVMVPFLAWALSGGAPRPRVLLAAAAAVAGAWLLAGGRRVGSAGLGDALLIAGDFAWALMIALAPVVLRRAPRPVLISFMQNGLTGGLGVAAALAFESNALSGVTASLPQLIFAGALSSGIAYTLQVIAQAHAPPAEAALILSLESVFAAVAGAWLLSERLSAVEMTGCALILAAVAIVELGPAPGTVERPAEG